MENGWLEEVKETIDIKIPAWIKEDAYIKYSWKWDAGIWDAPDGDLYLKIRIVANNKYINSKSNDNKDTKNNKKTSKKEFKIKHKRLK